jgi:hypothetical protein
MAALYSTSPIKRERRTKADMARIRDAILALLEADHPQTNRQVFYQVETMGLIAKTEQEYKGTICRLLAELRLAGDLRFDWIADNTRWMRKPKSHSGITASLEAHATGYRRALWDNQHAYVEVWLEKDALAGVLVQETDPWDAPLMVTRGYASLSFLHSAAETISAVGKPAYLYYFGDYDPSGLDIDRNVERRLREFAPSADITFERVAVTPEQIEEWRLPTRPTKQTDSRSGAFHGTRSVEVDAIPAHLLRALVCQRIEQHVNAHALAITRQYEHQERLQSNLLVWLTRRHGFERVVETAASVLEEPYGQYEWLGQEAE